MASSQDSQSFRWHYAEVDDKNFQIHGRSLLLVIILFSILILLTFLCLYTRWLCRYRQFAAPGIRPTQEHLPMAQLGLDAMTINSFPVHLHQSSTEEGQCSICLSSFQDEEKVKVLPDCNHSFHPECVDMWLSTHSSCPLCRSSLRKSSVDQLNEVA